VVPPPEVFSQDPQLVDKKSITFLLEYVSVRTICAMPTEVLYILNVVLILPAPVDPKTTEPVGELVIDIPEDAKNEYVYSLPGTASETLTDNGWLDEQQSLANTKFGESVKITFGQSIFGKQS